MYISSCYPNTCAVKLQTEETELTDERYDVPCCSHSGLHCAVRGLAVSAKQWLVGACRLWEILSRHSIQAVEKRCEWLWYSNERSIWTDDAVQIRFELDFKPPPNVVCKNWISHAFFLLGPLKNQPGYNLDMSRIKFGLAVWAGPRYGNSNSNTAQTMLQSIILTVTVSLIRKSYLDVTCRNTFTQYCYMPRDKSRPAHKIWHSNSPQLLPVLHKSPTLTKLIQHSKVNS